jgi:transporter family-2 protein
LLGTGTHMTSTVLTSFVLVFCGGMALAVQAPLNAALGKALGGPILSGMISFLLGATALVVITILTGGLGGMARAAAVPWWAWWGGLFGAFYIVAMIFAVPHLGVVTAIAMIVAGQLVAALVLDAFGAFGVPVHPISPQRVLAVVLVCAAVYLSRRS